MIDVKIKNCAACGEEILAVAKKCKHCGEWFEVQGEATAPVVTKFATTAVEESSATAPNYSWLVTACWAAMFVTAISGLQEFEITRGGNKMLGLLVWIASSTPDWLVILCGGALSIYVLVGLRQHCIAIGKTKVGPILPLMCLYVGLCFLALIASFISDSGDMELTTDEDMVIGLLLMTPLILFAIAYFIVQFIVGIKLREHLPKGKRLGTILILSSIVIPILLIITGSIIPDVWLWGSLGTTLIEIVWFSQLKSFFKSFA